MRRKESIWLGEEKNEKVKEIESNIVDRKVYHLFLMGEVSGEGGERNLYIYIYIYIAKT